MLLLKFIAVLCSSFGVLSFSPRGVENKLMRAADNKNEFEFSSSYEDNVHDEENDSYQAHKLGGALWCEEIGTCSEATVPMNLTYKDVPSALDWRNKNKVSKIKDQKDCMSCAFFSVAGMLESMIAIQKNIPIENIDLSEQELEECGSQEGRKTCNRGSNTAGIVNRIIDLGGQKPTGAKLYSEKSYPWTEQQNLKHLGNCEYGDKPEKSVIANVKGTKAKNGKWQVRILTDRTEKGLMAAVSEIGPVSVSMVWPIELRVESDESYDECEPKHPDGSKHAVVVIGYGTDDKGDYWLIKNSWGETWPRPDESAYIGPDDKGFGKLGRRVGIACEILREAYSADIA